jgi:hypothetical protein
MRGLVVKVVLTPDTATRALRAELHGALANILTFAQNDSSPSPADEGILVVGSGGGI